MKIISDIYIDVYEIENVSEINEFSLIDPLR